MTRIVSVVLGLTVGLTLAMAAGPGAGAAQQEASATQRVSLGPRMSVITPGLMQVGAESNFFLTIADQIDLVPPQRSQLEQLFFDFQTFNAQKVADLAVAEAELRRLLTRDAIDMAAVRAKVEEASALGTDVQLHQIESLLSAIAVLTHEQHLKVVALSREVPTSNRVTVP